MAPSTLAMALILAIWLLWPVAHDAIPHTHAQECQPFPGAGYDVCLNPQATVTPIPTAAPPTPTPLPPTSTPLPVQTWNGVPVCSGHLSTVWHPLVERDGSGAILCTYTHDHGDDPRPLDAVFGEIGTYWGAPGHAISYPWVSSPVENIQKHELFKLIVREGLPNPGTGAYVRNMRAWNHRLGSGGHIPGVTSKDGFQTLVHSWALEVELCRNDGITCGIWRSGGYQDLGVGLLDDAGPAPDICALAVAAFNGLSCAEQHATALTPTHLHGTLTGNRRDATWYSKTSPAYRRVNMGMAFQIDFGTLFEAWAPVDPNDFSALPFHDPDVFDGSYDQMEILGLNFNNRQLPGWGMVNGRNEINGAFWVDQWGVFKSGCTAPGVDCVPWIAEHLPAVNVQYRDSNIEAATGKSPVRERGVQVNGKSMARYPN